MQSRTILLLLLALVSLTVNAQDRIYTRKKGMIEAKIMDVSPKVIIYRKAENISGKDYDIPWADVHKIEYASGKESFSSDYKPIPLPRERKPQPGIDYGRNIISAALTNVNDEGVGFGMAYEYSLDKKKQFGLQVPVNITFGMPTTGNGATNDVFARNKSLVQLMPNLRFYPTGNNGKVRYAVGPQLTYEAGKKLAEMETLDGQGISVFRLDEYQVQKMGVMVNNSLNMFPAPYLYMALDLALGFTYINRLDNIEQGTRQLVQFNFRMGYRF